MKCFHFLKNQCNFLSYINYLIIAHNLLIETSLEGFFEVSLIKIFLFSWLGFIETISSKTLRGNEINRLASGPRWRQIVWVYHAIHKSFQYSFFGVTLWSLRDPSESGSHVYLIICKGWWKEPESVNYCTIKTVCKIKRCWYIA